MAAPPTNAKRLKYLLLDIILLQVIYIFGGDTHPFVVFPLSRVLLLHLLASFAPLPVPQHTVPSAAATKTSTGQNNF